MSWNTVPSIFIGSSNEARTLTKDLADRLTDTGEVRAVPWYTAFNSGFAALEDLVRRSDEVDFAAFFLVCDDQLNSRSELHLVPRDNVLFELGLFMGRLGRRRTFALVDEPKKSDRGAAQGATQVKLPGDLSGVTTVRFGRDDLAAAVERVVRDVKELGPVVRPPHAVHVVEGGSADPDVHDTLSSAIRTARPRDVILVRPGIYAEEVVIDRPVEILGVAGMGDRPGAVVQVGTAGAIRYEAAAGVGRISGLTVEGGGPEDCASIDVVTGQLVVDSCEVGTCGPVEAALRVRGNGRARIVGNRVAAGTGIGVLVCERGDADLSNNVIEGHAHSCVEVRDGSRPRIVNNRIARGHSGGVLVRGAGTQPRIGRNDIFENRDAGLAVVAGALPAVDGNRVHHGYGPGLWVGDGGGGTFSENDVYENRGTAVEIASGGRPLLVNNRVYNGAGGGVLVAAGGCPRIEHNEVRGNERAGIVFQDGAAVERFSHNTVVDGRAEGVFDEVGVPGHDNFVARNAGGDWRRP